VSLEFFKTLNRQIFKKIQKKKGGTKHARNQRTFSSLIGEKEREVKLTALSLSLSLCASAFLRATKKRVRVSFSSFLSAFHFLKNNARETLSEEIKEDGKESVRVRACVCVKERERERDCLAQRE